MGEQRLTARDVFALASTDRQRVLAASGASVIAVRLLEQLPVHAVDEQLELAQEVRA